MLVLLITYFFMGGGYSEGSLLTIAEVDSIIERIETVVSDPNRANMAKQSMTELKEEIDTFNKKFENSGSEVKQLYISHEAVAAQMHAQFDKLNHEWHASQQKAIDLRFKLKETITVAEWDSLFSAK